MELKNFKCCGGIDNHEGKMTRTGTCLAVYSLEGQPGNSTYLKRISKTKEFNTDDVGYGSTIWKMKMDILSLCNRE